MEEEKRSECCCPPVADITSALTPDEKRVRDHILFFISRHGSMPNPEAIQRSLKLPSLEHTCVLFDSLIEKGLLYREPESKAIVSAYPVSVTPTEHQVVLADGRKVYAMCAVDSLGIPLTFAEDATIASVCHHCRHPITIRIQAGKIVRLDPSSTVVWHKGILGDIWAEEACPFINFFCSADHMSQWKNQAGFQQAGLTLTVEEAMDRAREISGEPIEV